MPSLNIRSLPFVVFMGGFPSRLQNLSSGAIRPGGLLFENSFDFVRSDVSKPVVTHGSLLVYSLFALHCFNGKADSNAVLYRSINLLYASFGHLVRVMGSKISLIQVMSKDINIAIGHNSCVFII